VAEALEERQGRIRVILLLPARLPPMLLTMLLSPVVVLMPLNVVTTEAAVDIDTFRLDALTIPGLGYVAL
jgi:hypothetical protein